jgi:hypothetical protein
MIRSIVLKRVFVLLSLMAGALTAAGSDALIQIPLSSWTTAPPGIAHPVTRVELCLNGAWRFCPIYDRERLSSDELLRLPSLPTEGWGVIRVPGKRKQVSGDEAADSFG